MLCRYSVLLRSGVLLLLALSCQSTAFAVPNVLMIVVDDLNCHLRCYGDPVAQTPHIDRLAARGVLFERAYAQYPVCNPSRCSFLSGLRPDVTGIYGNSVSLRTRLPDVVTLPQLFRTSGWFTAGISKVFHVSQWDPPDPADEPGRWRLDDPLSWDYRRNTKRSETGQQGVRMELAGKSFPGDTINFRLMAEGDDDDQEDGQVVLEVERQLRASKDKPFFIAAGLRRPHAAWVAPKKYFAMYPLRDLKLPEAGSRDSVPELAFTNTSANYSQPAEMLYFLQAYLATVSFVDAQIGRLVDLLADAGVAENTIIVLCGDHGFHIGEHGLWHKGTLFEESARTPLIISAPGVSAGRCSRVVELLDIYPTLADLCDLTVSSKLAGQSLRPLLQDPRSEWSGAAFTQVRRRVEERTIWGRSIRTERWRYTSWDGGKAGHELYDHRSDPSESTNLADDERYRAVVQELGGRL